MTLVGPIDGQRAVPSDGQRAASRDAKRAPAAAGSCGEELTEKEVSWTDSGTASWRSQRFGQVNP